MNAQQPDGIIKVEEHSLGDLLSSVQELVLKGYEVDLSSNDNYPYCYVGYYSCGMVKVEDGKSVKAPAEADVVESEVVVDGTDVKPEVKRGRKPKGG
jgi:hypothetical protein